MNSTEKKRILVLGAGAIGGYVGGSLSLAGHEVVFLATTATRAELRAHGLRLSLGDGEHTLHPTAVTEAGDAFAAGGFDLAVIAVKRYDTRSAASPLTYFAGEVRAFLNLQNGVGAEDDLRDLLGEVFVIPGTVTTAVGRPARNRIVVERLRGIGLAGRGSLVSDWAQILDNARLRVGVYPDAGAMKWSKLVTNLVANPVSAILDMPPGRIFNDPDLFRLEMLQLREALRVMDALGHRVVDLPGTPVRLLALCVRRLPLRIARPLLSRALSGARGDKMPSFHADLKGGAGRSEIDFYHGAVAACGLRLGIPTPVNAVLHETMRGLLDGKIPKSRFRGRPERLVRAVEDRLESG